jgi:hypothetical protein
VTTPMWFLEIKVEEIPAATAARSQGTCTGDSSITVIEVRTKNCMINMSLFAVCGSASSICGLATLASRNQWSTVMVRAPAHQPGIDGGLSRTAIKGSASACRERHQTLTQYHIGS